MLLKKMSGKSRLFSVSSTRLISPTLLKDTPSTILSRLIGPVKNLTNDFSAVHSVESGQPDFLTANQEVPDIYEPEVREAKFDLHQFGGYVEILRLLSDYVVYLQDPDEFTKGDILPLKGLLLTGPPGTGKTRLAESIAGHAGVPYIYISASEIKDKFVGNSEKRLRKLFDTARNNAPCVLCLDELDSIAGIRSPDQPNFMISLVNELLTQLGQDNNKVVVIGITNHFERLDSAVVRPGRFDRCVHIPLPVFADRLKILEVHSRSKTLDSEVKLSELADISTGFSGAKLAAWVNEAAIQAAREKSCSLTREHFDRARDIIQYGASGRSHTDPVTKVNTAIHEIGHALIWHLLTKEKIYKVSIRMTAGNYGYTEFLSRDANLSQQMLRDMVCRLLGGRAAEVLYSIPQSGSKSDFDKAKALAHHMLEEGMGETLSGLGGAAEIDAILKTEMARAIDLLQKNKDILNRAVATLLEAEELYGNELEAIFAGRPFTLTKPRVEATAFSVPSFLKKADSVGGAAGAFKAVIKTGLYAVAKPSLTDQFTFLTKKQLADALQISLSDVRRAVMQTDMESKDHSGNIKIFFSFSDHPRLLKISTMLRKNGIENAAYGDHSMLSINSSAIKKFVDFVEKNGGSSFSPRRP